MITNIFNGNLQKWNNIEQAATHAEHGGYVFLMYNGELFFIHLSKPIYTGITAREVPGWV